MKKNPYFYRGVNPTVDLIVVNPEQEILVIRRSKNSNSCPSMLAFPGGFIDSQSLEGELWTSGLETPKEAALRELAEETNLILEAGTELTLIGAYEGHGRDPRDSDYSWSKTYAYLFFLDQEMYQDQKNRIKGMDDAEEAIWIKLAELRNIKLAFDHNLIWEDVLKVLGR
jgi:ADP-ribose pyrophosphatase YjhB (NUDIX family)